ncbi:MAG: WXG100 family type VII secretion target [Nocardioides sp.]|uniref:WXG100 family type VII secretion target n=1 Tax=Nocardioides sp. TaxID=35761 RepID=UPI003EFF78F6
MEQVHVMHEAFAKARTNVSDAQERLRNDRDRIDRRVTGFLGTGWTGEAADSVVDAWDDWKVAAGEVLEGLVAMGVLLEATHRDFVEADDASQERLDQLAARIVDRLG